MAALSSLISLILCLILITIKSQPTELWGSGLGIKREDSVNPYCHICVTILTSKENPFETYNPCDEIAPLNEQEVCNYVRDSMKVSHDVKLVAMNGCVDFTAPDGVPMQFNGPSSCPSLVACNIIQSESEGPMCGPYIRAWGDYIPKFGGWNRPIRPNPLDLAPDYIKKPTNQIMRFTEARNAAGNPMCSMCIDIFNHFQIYKTKDESTACAQQPLGLREMCKTIAADFIRPNAKDIDFVLEKGCIDFTTIMPTIRPSAMCPGIVACNLIQTPRGGPYCGATLGTYGRMNLGAQIGKGGQSNSETLERPGDGAPMPFAAGFLELSSERFDGHPVEPFGLRRNRALKGDRVRVPTKHG